MKLKHLYLLLSILGVCYTWYYNILYFNTTENLSLIGIFKDTQNTFAGKSFGADLTIVVLTFFVFMIPESIKLKIKCWWLLIPFTFPFFLYLRTNALEKLKQKE
jgi:hypothetical protein